MPRPTPTAVFLGLAAAPLLLLALAVGGLGVASAETADASGPSGSNAAAIGPFSNDDLYWLCRAAAIERGVGACSSITNADLRWFCQAAADRNRRSGGTCGSIANPDLKLACEAASGHRSYLGCDNVVDPDWRELCKSWYQRYDGCAQVSDQALKEVCRTATGVVWVPRTDACESIRHSTQAQAPRPRTASQSSTDFGGAASRAIDGSTDGNWNAGSVTHTAKQDYPWWQLDLGRVESVAQVTLYNRTDCCAERLSNFYVFASEQPFGSNDPTATRLQGGVWSAHRAGAAGGEVTFDVGRRARYVRVQLADTGAYLSLAEVQVTLGPPPPFEPPVRAARINFDNLPRGEVINKQLMTDGVVVSGLNNSGQVMRIGQVLDVTQVDVGVQDFGGSKPNALLYGVVGDALRFDFVLSDGRSAVTNFVSIRVGDGDPPAETFRVSIYGPTGELLGSQERTTQGGATAGGATVTFEREGIHRLEILGIGPDTGGAVDDLDFNPPALPGR